VTLSADRVGCWVNSGRIPRFLHPVRAGESQTSGAFQLRAQDGQGITNPAAMLEAAGQIVLNVRRVSEPETLGCYSHLYLTGAIRAHSSSGAGDDAVRAPRQCDEQTQRKQQETLREGDEEA
jgi:hypothetical protein